MWSPISMETLASDIAASVAEMEDRERRLWEMVGIPPVKWRLHPWGDEGGGFWVVGIIGGRVRWYNDIEGGFNVSRYDEPGTIAESWCNQDELRHTLWFLGNQVEAGCWFGEFGPPESPVGGG